MTHVGLGDEYGPAAESFLAQVQQRAAMTGHEEAIRVTRATIDTLAESLSSGQMDALATGLPPDLRPGVDEARGHARSFDKTAFLDRLAGHISTVDIDIAETQARAVLATLNAWAPQGEIDNTLAQLPPDLADLFNPAAKQ